MRCSYSTLVKAKRAGRASSVKVQPTGTAVSEYQVNLGQRNTPRPVGVVRSTCWSDPLTETETWIKIPRLSTTCPSRVVTFAGGRCNIRRTMGFCDEFTGSSIDATQWATSGNVSVSNSEMTATSTTPTVYSYILSQNRVSSVNTAVRARLKMTRFGATNALTAFGVTYPLSTSASGQLFAFYADDGGLAAKYRNYDGSAVSGSQTITGMASAVYAIQDIARTSTSVRYSVDNANVVTIATNVPTADLQIVARTAYPNAVGVNNPLTVDWIVIRKYVASGPISGTVKPSTTNRALCKSVRHSDLLRACCNKV